MKKSISIVAIAALFAVGSAFVGRYQQDPILQWNVDHPEQGTPGIFFLTAAQVKNLYCPGINNSECAYLISTPSTIIKKP
jgi:hypothetical protein